MKLPRSLLLTILVGAMLLPAFMAGTSAAPEMSDPAGDQAVLGEVSVGAANLADGVDLLSVWFEHDATNVYVYVHASEKPGTGITALPIDSLQYAVTFSSGGVARSPGAALAASPTPALAPVAPATAISFVGDDLRLTIPRDAIALAAGGTITVTGASASASVLTVGVGPASSLLISDSMTAAAGTTYVIPGDPTSTAVDTDKDGLNDTDEDKNSDGILDANETDPNDPDTDDDGASDGEEIAAGTDPRDPNSKPTYPDPDGDILSNNTEAAYGTNPDDPDTDHDGVTDYEEVVAGSDPLNATSLPANFTDTDRDGLSDFLESLIGTNSTNPDTDGDGASDYEEYMAGTDPTDATDTPPITDTDGDGLSDSLEAIYGTDPTKADTDGDGLTDREEIDLGTDPLKADTDGDGFTDKEEVDAGTDPLDATSKPATSTSSTTSSTTSSSSSSSSSSSGLAKADVAYLGVATALMIGTVALGLFGLLGRWV